MVNSHTLVRFVHGKEGIPWGRKIVQLAEVAKQHGCMVESPDHTQIPNPDQRARSLAEQQTPEQLILVGSSMGAYAATVASASLRPCGLFLLAPAVYLPGYADQDPKPHRCPTVIIHGWQDSVVPVYNAIQFAQKHHLMLHLIDDDHRLIQSLPYLSSTFSWFLQQRLTG